MAMLDRTLVWLWRHWRPLAWWLSWLLVLTITGLYFGSALQGRDQTWFLPGPTTHGHYQIETDCMACHAPYQGVTQESCLECHGAELAQANDSHPDKKFRDPRNVALLERLNARACVSCHGEHGQEHTYPIGVTQPPDFCEHCHREVAKDRPSHAKLPFDGCRDCHNYHDNRALYEDFLAKHLDEPETREPARAILPIRNFLAFYAEKAEPTVKPLTLDQQDAPVAFAATLGQEWEISSHARAGVNCKDCHTRTEQPEWVDRPDHRYCETCHRDEVKGFLGGRHGMRLAREMAPMSPGDARLPMWNQSFSRVLGCDSCHQQHRFETTPVATGVETCLGCHRDEHSLAYKSSSHFRLLQEPSANPDASRVGVSCANCHLPREVSRLKGKERVKVQHNQNHNLRPNQKMVRDVCLRCHGLGFTLDALADKEVIRHNFNYKPGRRLRSLDMTARRANPQPPQQ